MNINIITNEPDENGDEIEVIVARYEASFIPNKNEVISIMGRGDMSYTEYSIDKIEHLIYHDSYMVYIYVDPVEKEEPSMEITTEINNCPHLEEWVIGKKDKSTNTMWCTCCGAYRDYDFLLDIGGEWVTPNG